MDCPLHPFFSLCTDSPCFLLFVFPVAPSMRVESTLWTLGGIQARQWVHSHVTQTHLLVLSSGWNHYNVRRTLAYS